LPQFEAEISAPRIGRLPRALAGAMGEGPGMCRCFLMLALAAAPTGCLVPQRQDTPAPARRQVEPTTETGYWLYVPSTYQAGGDWPLVVTLHGSRLWDSAESQIREWKYLAEQRGAIVVAPELRSVCFWRVFRRRWRRRLEQDERAVLAIIDQVSRQHPRGSGKILLTGFLEGGYPLYYIGLRNANRVSMLIARDCYTDAEMLAGIALTDYARKLPMVISNGKDGWWAFPRHGWRAYRYLRENRCFHVKRKEHRGGQLRQPEKAYQCWRQYVPP